MFKSLICFSTSVFFVYLNVTESFIETLPLKSRINVLFSMVTLLGFLPALLLIEISKSLISNESFDCNVSLNTNLSLFGFLCSTTINCNFGGILSTILFITAIWSIVFNFESSICNSAPPLLTALFC